MKLITLDCTKCGAPLEGRAGSKSLDCEYCGTSVLIAEARQAAGREDRAASGALYPSEAHRSLADLDRRWRRDRECLVTRNDAGAIRVPTTSGAILSGIAIASIGVLSLKQKGGAYILPISCIFGIAFALFGWQRARTYESAHRRYQQKRRQILKEIAEQRA